MVNVNHLKTYGAKKCLRIFLYLPTDNTEWQTVVCHWSDDVQQILLDIQPINCVQQVIGNTNTVVSHTNEVVVFTNELH